MQNLIGLGSLVVNIIVLIVISYGYVRVIKNDLLHLGEDVAEIKKDVKECILPKLFKLTDRISKVEGELEKK